MFLQLNVNYLSKINSFKFKDDIGFDYKFKRTEQIHDIVVNYYDHFFLFLVDNPFIYSLCRFVNEKDHFSIKNFKEFKYVIVSDFNLITLHDIEEIFEHLPETNACEMTEMVYKFEKEFTLKKINGGNCQKKKRNF